LKEVVVVKTKNIVIGTQKSNLGIENEIKTNRNIEFIRVQFADSSVSCLFRNCD